MFLMFLKYNLTDQTLSIVVVKSGGNTVKLRLTYYSPVLLIYTPEKIKPSGFLIISGGIDKQHRAVMG